jgi:hypothetical protein
LFFQTPQEASMTSKATKKHPAPKAKTVQDLPLGADKAAQVKGGQHCAAGESAVLVLNGARHPVCNPPMTQLLPMDSG